MDQRMSRAMGMSQSIRIPLGKTPDDAIQLMFNPPMSQVLHREPVDDGVLVFTSRFQMPDSSHLRVDYVRKVWLGWKWVWGGEYSIGYSTQSQPAMNFMDMPKLDHTSSPFPMVLGDVIDPLVEQITVETGDGEKYDARITEASGRKIWFVFLPPLTSPPLVLNGFDHEGNRFVHETIGGPRDYGSIHRTDENST